MRILKNQKFSTIKTNFKKKELGYSINEMIITIAMFGVLATLIIPNFQPALEFVEVLILEKYLLKSVKECQVDIVNNEPTPQYSLPKNNLGLGISKNIKFIFSHTGIIGECAPYIGGNDIKISRINKFNNEVKYSLIINVVSGEKVYEGQIPQWLDWWTGKHSPIIPPDDDYYLR